MKWLRWTGGRQESGYQKMLLATLPFPLPFDFYLLRYPEGAAIDWHRDEVAEGSRHFRLNVVIKKAEEGGYFDSETYPIFRTGRIVLFRPDLNKHRVTEIKKGTRYVLSLGWLRND